MRLALRLLGRRFRGLLHRLGLLAGPPAAEGGGEMRDDLQVVWRNPTPPPQEKAHLSKGWTGDRLAIYPNGRQVWFEDVSGGHALPDANAAPRMLADDEAPKH